jgi:hypothetical protein
MTTWRHELNEAFLKSKEIWPGDVIETTLTNADLDKEFDSGFGGTEGCPFTLWTAKRVYFPVQYDGAEWVDSVSRNPDGIATEHIGGG